MSVIRAEVIAKMRGALRDGLSAGRFITSMREVGLGYRRSDMLADWRSVNQLEKKEGLLRFVRKDYFPTAKTIATVDWRTSKEFMYKVKVSTRLRPDEPILDRFVNIMSDVPMTPEMVEAELLESWGEWEKYKVETLTGIQVWSVVQRAKP